MIPRRCWMSPTKSPMYSSGVVISSFMIGSSSTGPAFRRRLLKGVAGGDPKGHLVGMERHGPRRPGSSSSASSSGNPPISPPPSPRACSSSMRRQRNSPGTASGGQRLSDHDRRSVPARTARARIFKRANNCSPPIWRLHSPVTSIGLLDRLAIVDARLVDFDVQS